VVEPRIAALLPKVGVTVEPALTAAYPAAWPARLAISLADGRTLEAAADYPRGHPEAPAPVAELEAKARGLIAPLYGEAFADRVVGAVRGLRDAEDMAGTMRGLMAAAGSE
jgi:2-methylcitrate dehydratase PrpD